MIGITLILFSVINQFEGLSTVFMFITNQIITLFGGQIADYKGENKTEELTKVVMGFLGVICFLLEVFGFLVMYLMDAISSTVKDIRKVRRNVRKKVIKRQSLYNDERKRSVAATACQEDIYENDKNLNKLDIEKMNSKDHKNDVMMVNLKNIKHISEDVESCKN